MTDQRPYDWGDPPPARIDWGLVKFCLAYVTVIALLVHFAGALR